jgi:hypothetical protein
VGTLQLLDDLVPLVALAVAYLTVRALLLDVVRARENFDPRLVPSAGEAALGGAIALLAIDHPWNVVVLVPLAIALHQSQVRLRGLQRETLRALETFANIVDERDPSTYRHSVRVAGYVDSLARALRLPFSRHRPPALGRPVARPRQGLGRRVVLRKSGRLDGAEWAAMRRHPRPVRAGCCSVRVRRAAGSRGRVASTSVSTARLLRRRRRRSSRLASHFLIVADSFDAMTTDRPYRKACRTSRVDGDREQRRHAVSSRGCEGVRRGAARDRTRATVLTPEEVQEMRRAVASTGYRLVGAGS